MTYKKELALGLGCLLLSLFFFTIHHRSSQEALAAEIAPEILRFRILANSDSRQDQQLKIEIRDAVLKYMQELSSDNLVNQDKEEFTAVLAAHLSEIESLAEQMIVSAGYNYTAAAELVNCHFPPKTYGSLIFPEGCYDALRITLGKGKGLNWWCVLYPQLCFTDAACSSISPESETRVQAALESGEHKSGSLLIEDRRPEIRFLIQDLNYLLQPSHNSPLPGKSQAWHSQNSFFPKDKPRLTADIEVSLSFPADTDAGSLQR